MIEFCSVKVQNQVTCHISKSTNWRGVVSYEIYFPPEETLKSLYFGDKSEVYKWLDRTYGAGEWVVA